MSQPRNRGFHHVAFACRDLEATRRFYEDLLGMPLVHTEVKALGDGFFRHVFFDTGDGTMIAFFDLHGVGEPAALDTAVSTGLGLPLWVNHVAFAIDAERLAETRARLKAAGVRAAFKVDHGWCQSAYYLDPNGILVELCRDTPGFAPDPALAHARLTRTDPTG